MRTYVMIVAGLLFALLITGCGGSSSKKYLISGITRVEISSSDVSGKTFYIKNIDGTISQLQFNSDSGSTAAWNGKTGTWAMVGGNIVLTEAGTGSTQTFACIQKETDSSYWLIYDVGTNVINRLYSDQTLASAYNPRQMGGAIQGKILSLTTNTTVPYGSSDGTDGFVNGSGTAARFYRPMGITSDGTNYYVADYDNNVIRMIDPSGAVTLFAGNPSGKTGSSDGTGEAAYFNEPSGITTDGKNLYVADYGNASIRQIVISTRVVTTIAGTSTSSGSVDADTGTSARFSSPLGITTDGTNLYVSDSGNHTIRKVVLSGSHAVSTLAGYREHTGSDDGVFTDARFNLPSRITTDGSFLYVADFTNRTIRKIAIATGTVTTFAGNYDAAPGSVDGVGTAATFYHLGGITTDGAYLYVGDYNDRITDNTDSSKTIPWKTYIRKINLATGDVTTIAGGATTDLTQVTLAGTGTSARFVTPLGITTNGVSLMVTNTSYNTISQID